MFNMLKKKKCPNSKIVFLFGLVCGIVVVSLFFAVALIVTSKSKLQTNTRQIASQNKKVKVEFFEDFECPFCLRHSTTIEQIRKEYVGKVDLVLRHFPLQFHANAEKAAEAYECAKEQRKEWEMYDKIFEVNAEKNMSVNTWKSAAKQLGLNTSQFDNCLDASKYSDKIKQDTAEARQRGVNGVPATFINGEMISGAAPYSAFKDVLDKNIK